MSGQRVDVKVVMLGKEYVGKTSLVERYVHDRFLVGPYQNTIGAAFVAKVMSVGDRTVTLGIWDTAGSERYEAMSRIYYRGAKAAIVCYDLTDSSSFERAKFWVKELRNLEEGCQIYLCGTKSDLLEEDRRRRRVDFHDVQDYADSSCSLVPWVWGKEVAACLGQENRGCLGYQQQDPCGKPFTDLESLGSRRFPVLLAFPFVSAHPVLRYEASVTSLYRYQSSAL
uniref:Ras-related protein Rab-24 n=2 Tax=Sus scrofa TaxID=9823 RepID=A0A8D0Z7Z4_PIG